MRLVRFKQNGKWVYPTVKDIGDISELKTKEKETLVDAINSLYDGNIGGGNGTGGGTGGTGGTGGSGDGNDGNSGGGEDNGNGGNGEIPDTGRPEIDEAIDKINQDLESILDDIGGMKLTDEELKEKQDALADDLLNKVDNSKYNEQYNQIIGDLGNKLSSSDYQTDKNQILEELKGKVDSIVIDGLEQRVENNESKLDIHEGKISNTMTKTEYDNAVGVNRWATSRYNTELSTSSTFPKFSHIAGKKADAVIDFNDSSLLNAFVGEKYIAHYFTHVKMKKETTIIVKLSHGDSIGLYLNGAMVYEASAGTSHTVHLSVREGWNTIEVLHYKHEGNFDLTMSPTISSQVDKMTAVIGVGNKDETRLAQAETQIQQTAEGILLKADKTEVTNLGNRIESAESSLEVQAGQIASKVEKTEFDKYSDRLSKAESSITQNAESILQKVEKTEFDTLNGKVTEQGTQINQLSDSIALKVDKTVVDDIAKRVTDTETKIELTNEQIDLKASKTELNNATERLSKAEATIELNTEGIKQSVSKKEFDGMVIGGRNLIKNSTFNMDLDKWTVSNKDQSTIDNTGGVDGGKCLKTVGAFGKSSTVKQVAPLKPNTTYTFTGWYKSDNIVHGNTNPYIRFYLTYYADSTYKSDVALSEQIVGTNGWTKITKTFTTRETNDWNKATFCYRTRDVAGTVWFDQLQVEEGNKPTDWTPAFEDMNDRISDVETAIEHTAEGIKLSATKKEVNEALDSKVDLSVYNEKMASIDITNGSILSTVKDVTVTVDGMEKNVGYAMSTVKHLSDEIESRVEKDGVISAIQQTAETIKISASKINLEGQITASHIKSLHGLNINDQFVVDARGNVVFKGDLTGASGTFYGVVSQASSGSTVTISSGVITSTDNDVKTAKLSSGKLEIKDRFYTTKLDSMNLNFKTNSMEANIRGEEGYLRIESDGGIRLTSEHGVNITNLKASNAQLVSPTISGGTISNATLSYPSIEGRMTTSQTEYGWCGTGGYYAHANNSFQAAGVWVPFRTQKTYAPSDPGLSTYSNLGCTRGYANLNQYGFWLYLQPNNSTAQYKYWRGTYYC